MGGQWASDPYGRAELRYHDGQRWTEHISTRGVASVETMAGSFPIAPPLASGAILTPTGASGRLIAAGVMMIIESAITAIIGLWLFSVSTSEAGEWVDDVSAGSLTFAAVLFTALGAVGLVIAINDCRGRNWARITTIVLHSIGIALLVVGMVSAASDSSGNPGGAIVPLLWNGVILFLAATGKPKELG